MSVYLLCFDEPIAIIENGPRSGQPHPTRHYIGFARDGRVTERLAVHAQGRGSRLVRAAVERGIGFELVRVWYGGSRALERYLKLRRQGPEFCPRCSPGRRQALHVEGDYLDVYRKQRVHVSYHRKRLVRPRKGFRWEPQAVASGTPAW